MNHFIVEQTIYAYGIWPLFWLCPIQGMLSARGKQLLMADADAATDIRDLPKLLTKLREIETVGLYLLSITYRISFQKIWCRALAKYILRLICKLWPTQLLLINHSNFYQLLVIKDLKQLSFKQLMTCLSMVSPRPCTVLLQGHAHILLMTLLQHAPSFEPF